MDTVKPSTLTMSFKPSHHHGSCKDATSIHNNEHQFHRFSSFARKAYCELPPRQQIPADDVQRQNCLDRLAQINPNPGTLTRHNRDQRYKPATSMAPLQRNCFNGVVRSGRHFGVGAQNCIQVLIKCKKNVHILIDNFDIICPVHKRT